MGKDTVTFFTHGTHGQYEQVLKLYPQAIRLKAERRAKKPEELIKLDSWYQYELPKKIKSRGKDSHMTHEELVQTMKWKQARGKIFPQLSYLIKVNTPRAVMAETKKAFRKLPNLEQAITALSNLKGVGTTMASALLAAAAPEYAPFMADECLLAIPDIEGIDYTTKEYLKFVAHISGVAERLNKAAQATAAAAAAAAASVKDTPPTTDTTESEPIAAPIIDADQVWSPHKVELALWTHYVLTDLKPDLLTAIGLPITNGQSSAGAHVGSNIGSYRHHHTDHDSSLDNGDSLDAATTSEESNQEQLNGKSCGGIPRNTAVSTTSMTCVPVFAGFIQRCFSNSNQNPAIIDEDTNCSFATELNSTMSSPLTANNNGDDDTNSSLVSDSTTNDSASTSLTVAKATSSTIPIAAPASTTTAPEAGAAYNSKPQSALKRPHYNHAGAQQKGDATNADSDAEDDDYEEEHVGNIRTSLHMPSGATKKMRTSDAH